MGTDAHIAETPLSEDSPLSADILARAVEVGATSIDELADLTNLRRHSIYPYLSHRDLSFSQFRSIFRRARSGQLRMMFLGDLVAGLGLVVTEVDAPMDVDGDGDVDCDDALASALQASIKAATAAQAIHASAADRTIARTELSGINDLLSELITQAVQAQRVVAFVAEQHPRKKCRPIAGVNGKGVVQ